MDLLQTTTAAVSLTATGQAAFVVPTDTIRASLANLSGKQDPTGALTLKKVDFENVGDEGFVTFHGSLQTPSLRIKAFPIPVEIGFVIMARVASPRVDPDSGKGYVDRIIDWEFKSLTPLDGLGPIGDLANTVVPKALTAGIKGVGKVAGVIPGAPRMPDGVKRVGGRIVPGFARRVANKVGTGVSSAASGAAEKMGDTAMAAKTKVKAAIINGLNSFLSRTPVFTLPEEYNGVPIKGVVRDIVFADSQTVVIVDVKKNPTLKKWWLAAAGVALAGGLELFDVINLITFF